eukprot:g77240.t1
MRSSLNFWLGKWHFAVSGQVIAAARGKEDHREQARGKEDLPMSEAQLYRKDTLKRRIVKETERLKKNPTPGITATPKPDNPRHFDITIQGPQGSCFENGIFRLEMFLPEEYPMVPPRVHFLTKIFHPNVDRTGRICLDILKDKWSPALQIPKVCLSIQLLLSTPNPEDPLDQVIAAAWKQNAAAAQNTAREWVKKYANTLRTKLRFSSPFLTPITVPWYSLLSRLRPGYLSGSCETILNVTVANSSEKVTNEKFKISELVLHLKTPELKVTNENFKISELVGLVHLKTRPELPA